MTQQTRPNNEPHPDNPYSKIYGRHLTDKEVRIAQDAAVRFPRELKYQRHVTPPFRLVMVPGVIASAYVTRVIV